MRARALTLGLCASALWLLGRTASAEPPRVHASGSIGHAIGGYQERELGFGALGDLGVELPLASSFGLEARAAGVILGDGKAPTDKRFVDRGAGGAGLGLAGVRVKDGVGAWASLGLGVAATDGAARFAFDAHAGWDFALDRHATWQAGPAIGYLQVVQPDKSLRPDDARVLSFGVHVAFDTASKCDDTDRDGICDASDVCPSTPGPRSDDPGRNGCPELDRDRDGIPDREDACPLVPGVRTGDPKTNGCPPPLKVAERADRDGDTVYDDEDACPDIAGIRTTDAKTNGCPPPTESAHVEGDRIVLDDVILFDLDSPRVRHASIHVVADVAKLLRDNADILEIDVEGHADRRGSDEYNLKLSESRAASVREILLKNGISADRVTVRGLGKSRPKTLPDAPVTALQVDRRVEFWIVRARTGPKPERVASSHGAK